MASILQFFIPQDRLFFPLFEKASGNLKDISKALVQMVNTQDMSERRTYIKKIEELEHVGDSITHDIFNKLSVNFITPFDREDIHALVSAIDDVADFIHGAAKRIDLYKVGELNTSITKLAELIEKSAEELNNAVVELKDMKNISKIKEACVRVNSVENHADDIFDMAVAKLFEEEKNAVELIKIKEVLSALETATDKCEDAANVIQSIVVKHA